MEFLLLGTVKRTYVGCATVGIDSCGDGQTNAGETIENRKSLSKSDDPGIKTPLVRLVQGSRSSRPIDGLGGLGWRGPRPVATTAWFELFKYCNGARIAEDDETMR